MAESVQELCAKLVLYQRKREIYIKSRIMQTNRLGALVAGTLGYDSRMTEAQRKRIFKKARKHIKDSLAGRIESPMKDVIENTYVGVLAFKRSEAELKKRMRAVARRLPVADWAKAPAQRGFNVLRLAVVVGECGDLTRGLPPNENGSPNGYANPAKLWRRMGCAPWQFEGKTRMGGTWKGGKEGKLPKKEWTRFGYSPRRRAIAYVLGKLLMMGNQDGPYRRRYDEAKKLFREAHPDYSDGRCNSHAMLLATKLLLKNLWCEWNNQPPNAALLPNTGVAAAV